MCIESSATSSASSTTGVPAEADDTHDMEPDELPSSSPPDNEFISDAFQQGQINEEDLKKEMQQLGMTSDNQGKPCNSWT